MRHRQPGKVCEGLWCLGREESCVYLLEGRDELLLISGGLSYVVPDVLAQMQAFGLDEGRIGMIAVLHAHFDHIGIIPFFCRRHPKIRVFGSARAWEILHTPQAVETINAFSRLVAQRMGRDGDFPWESVQWRNDVEGIAVRDGDRIPLAGREVIVRETPGHSSCSISLYEPRLRALFASDGGGIPYKEILIASGNSDFTRFQDSLETLKHLAVDYACADHYGWVDGEEAGTFIADTAAEAARKRAMIERIYRRTGSVDATVKKILDMVYRQHPDYFLAREIYEGVFRQMVRHIARALDERMAS